jgi:hypothetical protein
MNEFAAAVGWMVIAGSVIYLLGSLAESSQKKKLQDAENHVDAMNLAYRIALRRICSQSDDPDSVRIVKNWTMGSAIGGWAYLRLDHSEDEFRQGYSSTVLQEADEQIKQRGYPLYLEGGEIKRRW